MGMFNFEMPDELHKQFKIYAIRKNKTMQEIVLELVKKEMETGMPPNNKEGGLGNGL